MSSILKLLDELKNSESRKNVSERMMLSLLKEFQKPLEPSDFEKLSGVLSKLSVSVFYNFEQNIFYYVCKKLGKEPN